MCSVENARLQSDLAKKSAELVAMDLLRARLEHDLGAGARQCTVPICYRLLAMVYQLLHIPNADPIANDWCTDHRAFVG